MTTPLVRLMVAGILFSSFSCSEKETTALSAFTFLTSDETGITFENTLAYDQHLNAYTYRNFYNGAGVAVGDINNDGLLDIYLAGNQVDNKLYLNKGDFKFEDITSSAGVACPKVWSTGVSMADVNGDGWLDIFVCKSGPPMGGNRKNELFINNKDLTFTESAEQWGVADEGLSLHSVFFDYDHDNDLDFYLLNNSNRSVGIFDLKEGQRNIPDPLGGNKLYRNDGDRFKDVTKEAGIYSSAIGFGLGVTAADVNKDGWQDLFVSNDFFERDYLYINQQNGTFKESLESCMTEISMGSMGADIADLNNDAYPEIYVTEMLPETLDRIKTTTVFEDWNKYAANVKSGYYHQFTRNVLQLNNGPVSTHSNEVSFSEVGRYAGVHATDWSWGALIFDYNNDGLKDIFVANGIAKDLTDQDYINYTASKALTGTALRNDSMLIVRLMDSIPSTPLQNYLFENRGDMRFANVATHVGITEKQFSNGAAYGDLNNDGAIDLIVNNINAPVSIYQNNSNAIYKNNFVKVRLMGDGKNTAAFGAQVTLYCGDTTFYAEQSPVRGYLSSIDPQIHFGIGRRKSVDSLVVHWPNGLTSVVKNILVNTTNVVKNADASQRSLLKQTASKQQWVEAEVGIVHVHRGNSFVDFNRDRLLFEMMANEGQRLLTSDFNGDGLDDLIIGSSSNSSTSLWLQISAGKFIQKSVNVFAVDSKFEDTALCAFDADNDGDIDLFVGSGGNQFSLGAPEYKSRLYLNDGKANFIRQQKILTTGDRQEPTSFAINIDINRDGFDDLVVGSRMIPFYYGVAANAYVLMNDGHGTFIDSTESVAPEFSGLGLLKDGKTLDYDADGDLDLLICGEWMNLRLFENVNRKLVDRTQQAGLANTAGFWNELAIADVNGDGRPDFVAANQGLNTRYKASQEEPLTMYVNDFDGNSSVEQIICQRESGRDYPLVLLNDLVKQIPSVRKKFTTFHRYKDKDITQIFSEQQLKGARRMVVQDLQSALFINEGKSFRKKSLPKEAQLTKIYAIESGDFDLDGDVDVVLGGNQYRAKPEMGINAAGYGLLLKNDGQGNFRSESIARSGLYLSGEVRDLKLLSIKGKNHLLVMRNEMKLLTLRSLN